MAQHMQHSGASRRRILSVRTKRHHSGVSSSAQTMPAAADEFANRYVYAPHEIQLDA